MARAPDPRNNVYRALLARSGNRCAFPGCQHEVVNYKNQFVAEMCHIAAASPRGQRYDPEMSDEQRRSYDNLLILCHRHHVETNDVSEFPVSELQRMKREHEEMVGLAPYEPSDELVAQVALDMKRFWEQVEHANRVQHIARDLAVDIDVGATSIDLITGVRALLEDVASVGRTLMLSSNSLEAEVHALLRRVGVDPDVLSSVCYTDNPIFHRDWELLALALPNLTTRASVLARQLEIRLWSERVESSPEDVDARARLEQLKASFVGEAGSVGISD